MLLIKAKPWDKSPLASQSIDIDVCKSLCFALQHHLMLNSIAILDVLQCVCRALLIRAAAKLHAATVTKLIAVHRVTHLLPCQSCTDMFTAGWRCG